MIIGRAGGPLRGYESLLEVYFAGASDICRVVSREQARVGLLAAWRSGEGDVFGAQSRLGECLGLLLAQPRSWEASFFGCSVMQLSFLLAETGSQPREAVAKSLFDCWSSFRPRDQQEYITTRISADDVPVAHALERAGFCLLVPMVTLDRELEGVEDEVRGPVPFAVAEAKLEDEPAIAEIARTAFTFGRFSAEPRLSEELAGEMHATWARNCCNRSVADEVIVAREGSQPIGFIALRCRCYGEEMVGEINLIAVASGARVSGVGRTLVRAGCAWARGKARRMVVRTELPNTPAIRLYERCGFRVGEGSLYYRHWLRP